MRKIYSKEDPGILLAVITTPGDFNDHRNEIVPADEFLQAAAIRVNDGDKFRPHMHIWKNFVASSGLGIIKAQEGWIVMRGVKSCFV
jgi:hypothetical protein